MLDTAMLPHESGQCRMHRTVARASVEERLATNVMLARYLDGWAEAGPAKIADATTDDYDFHVHSLAATRNEHCRSTSPCSVRVLW